MRSSSVRAFGGALPPTMPSADFCVAVRTPCGILSLVAKTQRRPPEVRPTAFTARPPNLPPRSLMAVDFAIDCSLVRPGRPRYPVLVHRAAALLHASFRPRLAATPLRFANPSPPSGWVKDLHLQALEHARHTAEGAPRRHVQENGAGSADAARSFLSPAKPISICARAVRAARRPALRRSSSADRCGSRSRRVRSSTRRSYWSRRN